MAAPWVVVAGLLAAWAVARLRQHKPPGHRPGGRHRSPTCQHDARDAVSVGEISTRLTDEQTLAWKHRAFPLYRRSPHRQPRDLVEVVSRPRRDVDPAADTAPILPPLRRRRRG